MKTICYLASAIPGVEQKMPKEAPGVLNVLFSLQIAISVDATSCKPAAKKKSLTIHTTYSIFILLPAANPSTLDIIGTCD